MCRIPRQAVAFINEKARTIRVRAFKHRLDFALGNRAKGKSFRCEHALDALHGGGAATIKGG